MKASTIRPAGALIFLHGLGDSPAGWSNLKMSLPSINTSLSNLTYLFPPAPTIPISINGGMRMPGWFDIYSWPIAIGDVDDKHGIQAAVNVVEKQVELLQNSGIPRSRIIIGGFSQGAAIALQAAYNDAFKSNKNAHYAACICLSGWLTLVQDIDSQGISAISKKTPLFWGHGMYDDKVLFDQQSYGVNKLIKMGITTVTNQYPTGHSSTDKEIEDLACWIDGIMFGDETKEA